MSARYTIIGTLASGGMGTVFLARMAGSAGFSRLVAIKRLHPEMAAQRDFVTMLVDEARLASRIQHVNVIDTLDLVATDGAFSLVLEYVEGAALSSLMKYAKAAGEKVPHLVALAIIYGVLRGLEAAHEARGEEGQPLGIVHRDVSPQNILVGVDGIPRLIDFGIAKAMGRITATRPGEVRGKFAYMAPEQLVDRPATRQADIYAAGVLLWELLTGERLFAQTDQRAVIASVLRGDIRRPSELNPEIPRELDAIVLKATARELSDRYLTARDVIEDLAPFRGAGDDEVGSWVRRLAAEQLAKKNELLQNVAANSSRSIDDLMHELAQSGGTPMAPVMGSGPVSATPWAQYPALPLSGSASGMVSGDGMEVSSRPHTGSYQPPLGAPDRSWAILPVACALGFLVLVGGALGVRRARTNTTGTHSIAPPTISSVTAPPPPSIIVIPPSPPTEDTAWLTAASAESSPTPTPVSSQHHSTGAGEKRNGSPSKSPPPPTSRPRDSKKDPDADFKVR